MLPKNKLEKAVKDFLLDRDRIVLPDSKVVADFKTEILIGIYSLNALHPRCKPINTKSLRFCIYDNQDYLLEGIDFVSFNLYKSKN